MERTNMIFRHNNDFGNSGRTVSDERRGLHRVDNIRSSKSYNNDHKKVLKKRSGCLLALVKKISIGIAMFILIVVLSGPIGRLFHDDSTVVEANRPHKTLRYEIVEIQKGESLWSIAQDRLTSDFDDIYSYIDEVMKCNQLKDANITAGAYLMLPYYDND